MFGFGSVEIMWVEHGHGTGRVLEFWPDVTIRIKDVRLQRALLSTERYCGNSANSDWFNFSRLQ